MSTTNLESKDKLVLRAVIGLSIFVFVTVVVLNKQILPKPSSIPSWTYVLPMINAIINGTCSVLLLASLYFIKRKNIEIHKQINLTAFVLSSLFLVCYILYHWLSKETVYGDTNHDGVLNGAEALSVASSKSIYYFILISHIVLAAIVLPLVLLSFYRGLQLDIEKHRKLVRYSFPIWLYVTITGVVVYFMISPYYPIL
jgi:putative membrane protein